MKVTADKIWDKTIIRENATEVIEKPQEYVTKAPVYTEGQLREGITSYFQRNKATRTPFNIQEVASMFSCSVPEFRQLKGIKNNAQTQLIIKRAFLLCEASVAQHLLSGNSINLIFYAKNTYDWKDKQDISHEFGLTVKRIKYDTPPRLKKPDSVLPALG